jgi:non-heme chloroperoxidase
MTGHGSWPRRLGEMSGGQQVGLILGLLLCLSCANVTRARSAMIRVDPNTSLEVVDWGGDGFPVVFLAGLGHTAHVFDEFAPGLADAYHVIGITRRGFGRSSQPDSGYAIGNLAEDVHAVLAGLKLERVVLVGHSLGGDEMTLFASKYPDMVAALVYVEAAYNRVSARDSLANHVAPKSEMPLATAADSASAADYREYYARANGVLMPLSEIKAMYSWSSDGRLAGNVTPGRVYAHITGSLRDPDYSRIDMPALAVYGTDYPVTELFVDYDNRDPGTQVAMRRYHEASLRIAKYSRDHFRSHVKNGRAVEIRGAGHSVYITHASQVLKAMREFLADVIPQ